jgi:hypothetical protein
MKSWRATYIQQQLWRVTILHLSKVRGQVAEGQPGGVEVAQRVLVLQRQLEEAGVLRMRTVQCGSCCATKPAQDDIMSVRCVHSTLLGQQFSTCRMFMNAASYQEHAAHLPWAHTPRVHQMDARKVVWVFQQSADVLQDLRWQFSHGRGPGCTWSHPGTRARCGLFNMFQQGRVYSAVRWCDTRQRPCAGDNKHSEVCQLQSICQQATDNWRQSRGRARLGQEAASVNNWRSQRRSASLTLFWAASVKARREQLSTCHEWQSAHLVC